MAPEERSALARRLRELIVRHRRVAEVHAAMGDEEEAAFRRAIADLEERRAEWLERGAAPHPGGATRRR